MGAWDGAHAGGEQAQPEGHDACQVGQLPSKDRSVNGQFETYTQCIDNDVVVWPVMDGKLCLLAELAGIALISANSDAVGVAECQETVSNCHSKERT